MTFLEQTLTYYRGEKTEAILLTLFGLIALFASIAIYQQMSHKQIFKGLFYPIAFLGLFMLFVGAYNTYNNSQRLSNIPTQLELNQAQFVESEINRFEGVTGVNKWWLPLKITWGALLLIGLVLTFVTKHDLLTGLAIGLMIIGVTGFVIDGFAHSRARIYTEQLYKLT